MFNSVPGFLSLNLWVVPYFKGKVSEVGVCWNEFLAAVVFPVVCLAHNQNVVSTSEGVSVVGNWFEDDFTLISDSLVGAATIVVPFWNVGKAGHFGFESSAFRSESDARTIDPDVFSNNFTVLVDVEKVRGVLVVKRVGHKI